MSTISPPPWTYNRQHGTIYDAHDDASILYCASRTQGPIADANGALVAAAPDLQAALRKLVARIDRLLGPNTDELNPRKTLCAVDLEPELTGARVALEKSEGKT